MSDTVPPTMPTLEQMHVRMFREKAAKVSAALRDLADRIDRDVDFSLNREGVSYTRVAAQVVHETTWGTANLGLDNLISMAADADAARTKTQ